MTQRYMPISVRWTNNIRANC